MLDICAISECTKTDRTHSYCSMHRSRMARLGSYELPEKDHLGRLLKSIKKTDTCWLWQGRKRQGYGITKFYGKNVGVHRVMYLLCVGEIPTGLELDHLCRVTDCCNPKHLEAVTGKENKRRSYSPGGINFRKTECIRGHKFTSDNIYLRKTGKFCKTCLLKTQAKYRARKRLEVSYV